MVGRHRTLRAVGLTASHAGLLLGLVGAYLQQRFSSSGTVLLTVGAEPAEYWLSRDRQRVEPLPFALRLDSLTLSAARGFRPAALAWVSSDRGPFPIHLNRPLTVAGRKVLFLRAVPPGFPQELWVRADAEEFLLLYHQRVRTAGGRWLASVGYEPATQSIGFEVGREQAWLRVGDSARLAGLEVSLRDARLAARPGVVLLVNDAGFTPVIFAGFGLMLLGIALVGLVRWCR